MNAKTCVLILCGFLASNHVIAEVSVSRGQGANCAPVLHTLTTYWMDVRRIMEPPGAKTDITKPKGEHFMCVNPYDLRNSMERKVSTNASVRCYSSPYTSRLGACCNSALTACAQLNPGLFPDLMPKKKARAYEPPKSGWVRPPSDDDQWKSID